MVRFAHPYQPKQQRERFEIPRPIVEASEAYYDFVREELTTLAHNSFNDGYSRAIGDQFAALVWNTEAFLKEQPEASDAQRRLIYQFVEHMQKRITEMARNAGYVEDGLGI